MSNLNLHRPWLHDQDEGKQSFYVIFTLRLTSFLLSVELWGSHTCACYHLRSFPWSLSVVWPRTNILNQPRAKLLCLCVKFADTGETPQWDALSCGPLLIFRCAFVMRNTLVASPSGLSYQVHQVLFPSSLKSNIIWNIHIYIEPWNCSAAIFLDCNTVNCGWVQTLHCLLERSMPHYCYLSLW